MKKIAKTAVALLVTLSLLVVAPVNKAKAQFSASISIQTFYSELAPYGQWIDDPEYGYIWVPDVESGFRPYYTRGHWVMTRYGAMWVSSYSWGWAAFHYGRWAYNSYYGWVWIPDIYWGPSWVSWRWGGDYCGWAPLGPGISVSFSFGSGYSVPYDWWVFVPQRYCLSASFYNYRVAPQQNITYVRNTTIINNTYVNNNVTYVAGPQVNQIERATRNKVPVYNVANVSRPGKTLVQGNAVSTYRPQITKTGKAKPPAVVTRDQFIKNKTQRNAGVLRNTAPNRTQPINQPSQQTQKKPIQQQNNNKQAAPDRHQQTNQPVQQRQIQQQNNNRPVTPGRHEQMNQPAQQRPTPQQNNNRPVMPAPNQQMNQPTQQRQMPQQNNNRQAAPAPHQQMNQPAQQRQMPQPQQKPQQPKPVKGKEKENK